MNGILSVLKPPGMSSHDVVGRIRRWTNTRVGHTGTLDPLAAGVLVVTLGNATRLSDYILSADKWYRAEFVFGIETTTWDLEGEVLHEADTTGLTQADILTGIEQLTGPIDIIPPMFSAIKQDGRKLYDLARKGQDVERPNRPVVIYEFNLLSFKAGSQARAIFDIHCSKGTYIRSLAYMLGRSLECGATLGFLLRTQQGEHHINDAWTMEEIAAAAEQNTLAAELAPPASAIASLPQWSVSPEQAVFLRTGGKIPAPDSFQKAGDIVPLMCEADLVCLAEVIDLDGQYYLQPRKVF